MVPRVARDTGALDALSTTRASVPGNNRQENSRLAGCLAAKAPFYLADHTCPASGPGPGQPGTLRLEFLYHIAQAYRLKGDLQAGNVLLQIVPANLAQRAQPR